MKKYLLILPMAFFAAACEPVDSNTATGALTGAAIGAVVSDDDDRVEGALIGGAVGAVAAQLIGRTSSGNCIYRYPDGRQYTARCP